MGKHAQAILKALQYCDNGIVLQPVGSHATDPFALNAPIRKLRPRSTFICRYCGRASQSVEPCKGCGAAMTDAVMAPIARRKSDVEYYARGIDITELINDPATLMVDRHAYSAITQVDIVNMFEVFVGDYPAWVFESHSRMELRLLAGPMAHSIGTFTQAPSMLLGMPIVFSSKSPRVGQTGDIVLIDWKRYCQLDGYSWPDMATVRNGWTRSPCVILSEDTR